MCADRGCQVVSVKDPLRSYFEGLDQLKKSSDLTGNRTLNLPPCGIVPQIATLPCAPPQKKVNGDYISNEMCTVIVYHSALFLLTL
jgi:hypothetical protein